MRGCTTHQYSGSSIVEVIQSSARLCPNQTRRDGPTHQATWPNKTCSFQLDLFHGHCPAHAGPRTPVGEERLMREAGPGMWFLEGHEGPSMDSCLTLALVVSLCDCAGWCLGFCGADALRSQGELSLKTIFLLQVGTGALANAILFFHNISPILLGHKKKTKAIIVTHMAVANLLVLFSSGTIHTMATSVLRKPLPSLGFSSLSEVTVILWSFPDAVFIGLMVWSSGSIVLLLQRHHQRVQYIHTLTGFHRCPPETRAAHTVLLLVVTFVIFYMMNSVFTFYITVFSDFHLWNPRTPRICS
ncbi:vomeronasal 1 receptor, D9-like protein [Camelus ferus]|nr:vomeronasal 1 receptor, D9-like protein [Camelus ferus]